MGTFTSQSLFPSNVQLDYITMNIKDQPIYSKASLQYFEWETVDNFVEKVIEVLQDDETLWNVFGIQGQVTFYNHAEASLENSMEQMTLWNTWSP